MIRNPIHQRRFLSANTNGTPRASDNKAITQPVSVPQSFRATEKGSTILSCAKVTLSRTKALF